jgi:hypothetical protein
VKRLQEFASELKKEILELFKNPLPPRAPVDIVQPTSSDPPKDDKLEQQEEKLLWQAERESLESYIKELEQKIKYYEEEERVRSVSIIDNSALTNLSASLDTSMIQNSNCSSEPNFPMQLPNPPVPSAQSQPPQQQSQQQQQQPPQMMYPPPMYPSVYPPHPYWGPRNYPPPPASYPYQMPPPPTNMPNYRRY